VPFAESAGFRVYYEEHGSGEAILFVGGITIDHTGFGFQVEPLARRHRVIVFDNPGVGRTTGPDGPFTTALMAEVAAGLLAALGAAPAHVVGVSMGGAVAQELALDHAASVRSLLLQCTWGRPDPFFVALFRSWQTIARDTPDILDRFRAFWPWVFTPAWYEDAAGVAATEQMIAANPFPQSVRGFDDQAEACIAHDALDRVSAIATPTLITVGEHDLLVPPRHSYALHERIPGSLLHVWRDMGHAPWFEIPDEFNRLVEVWVDGAASAGAPAGRTLDA
jgi:pimeloyl-ACP methyl ester carboxylesterase